MTDTAEVSTAAAVPHEKLTMLTECWECWLLFNELPPQTWQLLLLTEPNSPLLQQTVDLCDYMDKTLCFQTNFPEHTAYRFSDCYKGLHNHNLLHQQLLLSAESSNYSICLRTAKKDRKKMLFICKHGWLYDEWFGENKPNEMLHKQAT